jgi:Flp pilus assembly protein TadB
MIWIAERGFFHCDAMRSNRRFFKKFTPGKAKKLARLLGLNLLGLMIAFQVQLYDPPVTINLPIILLSLSLSVLFFYWWRQYVYEGRRDTDNF